MGWDSGFGLVFSISMHACGVGGGGSLGFTLTTSKLTTCWEGDCPWGLPMTGYKFLVPFDFMCE